MSSLADIKKQMTDEWMSNEIVQQKFGFVAGDSFDDKFKPATMVNVIFYIAAYVVWLRETALDSWRSDVDATAVATRYGTKEWWHRIALAWQDGDVTSVIDGGVAYTTLDETKQKVKFCAVVENGRTLYLRVATGVSPNLAPLTEEELIRFQSYLGDVKPLGIRAVGQSYPADSLTIFANIYYDGERLLSEIDTEVKAAIESYLASIVFGGMIYKSKMIDAIQAVDGVSDVEITNIAATPSGGNPIWIGRNYEPKAGYAKVGGYGLNLIIE